MSDFCYGHLLPQKSFFPSNMINKMVYQSILTPPKIRGSRGFTLSPSHIQIYKYYLILIEPFMKGKSENNKIFISNISIEFDRI